MRKMPMAMYLWPGLPQLWIRGSWSALGLAVGAAAWLNVVMLGSFGWSELIDAKVRNILWVSLAILWIGAAMVSAFLLRRQAARSELASSADPFNQALDLYLKGDYYQVEHLLNKTLNKNFRDVEARLLLATMLRHSGRLDEATKQLDQLLRFNESEKWELEIQREKELLIQAKHNLKNKLATGTAIAHNANLDKTVHAA